MFANLTVQFKYLFAVKVGCVKFLGTKQGFEQ